MKNLNFKLTTGDCFEDNPEFKAIREFEQLTERQMRYVMLMEWHGSPLRMMKPEDRKYRAALMSGYKLEKDGKRLDVNGRNLIQGKVNTVEQARRVMSEIQHDHELEIKEAIDIQIDEIVNFLKMPDKNLQQLDKAVTLMTKLPTILENRKKILELLNFRSSDIVDTIEQAMESEEITMSILDEYNEDL